MARICGHELGCLDLAQQFASVTTDAVVVHFAQDDLTFRVDQESATQGHAFVFDHHIEIAAQAAIGIAQQRVLDLGDGRRAVGPCLVGEVVVGRNAVDFHAQFLELGIAVSQIAQFGRADEGEICRVEEEHRPFAFQIGFGDGDEIAVVISGGGEGLDFGIDQGHRGFLLMTIKQC